jgi:transcriptional regulator with XRE-family HTH domain
MAGTAFGDELRRLRRAAGKSLADLADALGCSIAFVSDVERGKKNPPPLVGIRKLLVCLGQEKQLPKMLTLAAQSRKSVEITVANQSQDVAAMLVALARRCNDGPVDQDVARKILRLIEGEGDQQK